MTKDKKGIIVINFKRISGEKALFIAGELAKIDAGISEIFEVVLALQPQDAGYISTKINVPVFIQDIFSEPESQFLPYLKQNPLGNSKIRGVILNHPQKKLPFNLLEDNIVFARKLGLEIILCATNIEEAFFMDSRYKPDYVAVEDEQLIGKDISFLQCSSEMVTSIISKVNNRILFGGGIKTPEDIKFVIEKGGFGVLMASVIIKSESPLTALENLLSPISYNKPVKKYKQEVL